LGTAAFSTSQASMGTRSSNEKAFVGSAASRYSTEPPKGLQNMLARKRKNWLEIEQVREAVVAKFTTRTILDETKLNVIGGQLANLGEEAGHRVVVVNFRGVERLSTEMLGKILALQRKVQARGGRLLLCEISPTLLEIFQLLKLTRLLTIHADEQAALQSV
jgi:anti-anti-sigma factor